MESLEEDVQQGIAATDKDLKERKMLDDRLKQRWASKARRRSSEFKRFIDDRLSLQENPKLLMLIGKHGKLYNSRDWYNHVIEALSSLTSPCETEIVKRPHPHCHN